MVESVNVPYLDFNLEFSTPIVAVDSLTVNIDEILPPRKKEKLVKTGNESLLAFNKTLQEYM